MERYTQGNEQDVILNFFGDRKGTFLDIGANDSITFSNTYALSLLGWSGVCVEPIPEAFAKCVETHEGRPVQCIEAAITTVDGPVAMQSCSDSLVSSLSTDAAKAWEHYGFEWKEIKVQGMTFATLLERSQYKRFEFISIDAEGHDLEILAQMDLEALGCELLCIEHGGKTDKIMELCMGWRWVYRDQINLILSR